MGIMEVSDAFSGSELRASFGTLTETSDWADDIANQDVSSDIIVVERVRLLWGEQADDQPVVVEIASALDLSAEVDMSVTMSDEAAEGVVIDHNNGCCCASCGMRPDETISLDAADGTEIPDDTSSAVAFGTLADMADYLRLGYWSDNGTVSRKFNLTDTGTNAKSGVLHYNVTGFSNAGNAGTDLSGLSAERADLVRDVLEGEQPIGFTSDWCKTQVRPTDWNEQRRMLATL